MAGPFAPTAGGLSVRLRLTPGGRANRIEGVIPDADGGRVLKAQVTAAPEKGKANQALVKMLAKEWGIAKSGIEVVQGQTARNKTLLIRGDGAALAEAMTNWCKTKGWSFND
ncbi:MAG TPA: hypothetical protein DCG48_13125 [Rhodospirillaceae bacterium]|nr:hypothetical protein [Rhodospirillaceae bacterium]